MNKKRLLGIILVIAMIFIMALPSLAGSKGAEEEVNFGILSLLPPLLAILLAFLTKQVLLSLFLGIFTGAMMLNGWNPFYGFLRTLDEFIVGSLADGWNAAIIIFTLSIGGMVGVISKMGGTRAIAEALAKRAKSPRSAQIVTWFLGIFVFFDDYANTLIVGPTMRPLTDKLNVSREKLAYIVDSTAAPVVGMALVSTWIGYEIGLINDAFANLGIEANVYEVFVKTIPFRFYSIFALVLVFAVAFLQREYGPMYKAEKRARLTGQVIADGAKPMAGKEMTDTEIKEGTKLRVSNALVPILTLVIVGFIGLWYNGYTYSEGINPFTWEGFRTSFGNADPSIALIWAAILSSIVAIVMGLSQKIFDLAEAFDSWIDGAKSLLITCVILVLAWSLGSVTEQVGAADYLVSKISNNLPGGLLPIIVFAISCIVAFATGTSWGTMAIVLPLAVPLAVSYINGDPASATLMFATIGSVLTGSIFGDHCSPISDTTIMSSMASASDHIDHVKTQAPYAITGAILAIIAYLIVGALSDGTPGLPLVLSLIMGIVAIFLIVRFVGKSVAREDLIAEQGEEINN
ncbi:Na+/H+ antiporter NhaC family protein [Sporosalibacterium faouarense]|uniref:Na+/H+ antiporter NhaC family protein n=1 Tax=Sporosalibacterium faouarense TaxID=516123 RepID=UPI00141C77B1|nr:Na+/H+ antiporter NhaC family protein [Sporosalibacterium faouarense]MTI49090.1 Na+/H+ antiporter NhaC family protein [Bacillota bacterium]